MLLMSRSKTILITCSASRAAIKTRNEGDSPRDATGHFGTFCPEVESASVFTEAPLAAMESQPHITPKPPDADRSAPGGLT